MPVLSLSPILVAFQERAGLKHGASPPCYLEFPVVSQSGVPCVQFLCPHSDLRLVGISLGREGIAIMLDTSSLGLTACLPPVACCATLQSLEMGQEGSQKMLTHLWGCVLCVLETGMRPKDKNAFLLPLKQNFNKRHLLLSWLLSLCA